ncbi:hypothetical protein [Streptomyces bullii]|uniref:FAD binding domain-containing protein n=1 Tax=Streptomyces bullii TaxID=349910 RepID=A0ABW0UYJ1_9ACTN
MVLLGDAAYGATRGGTGAGVTSVGAYVLAGELALAGGDHRTAFAKHETRLGSLAEGCRRTSGDAGPFFALPTGRRVRGPDPCSAC